MSSAGNKAKSFVGAKSYNLQNSKVPQRISYAARVLIFTPHVALMIYLLAMFLGINLYVQLSLQIIYAALTWNYVKQIEWWLVWLNFSQMSLFSLIVSLPLFLVFVSAKLQIPLVAIGIMMCFLSLNMSRRTVHDFLFRLYPSSQCPKQINPLDIKQRFYKKTAIAPQDMQAWLHEMMKHDDPVAFLKKQVEKRSSTAAKHSRSQSGQFVSRKESVLDASQSTKASTQVEDAIKGSQNSDDANLNRSSTSDGGGSDEVTQILTIKSPPISANLGKKAPAPGGRFTPVNSPNNGTDPQAPDVSPKSL